MQECILFLVRVQCRRKESSRSLSHLLMSFLFKKLLLRNCALNFVEICKVCARKATIKAFKRVINSDKMCRSYSDLNFGVTFFGTWCILYCMYDVVVKKVHVRYLISWWVSCSILLTSVHVGHSEESIRVVGHISAKALWSKLRCESEYQLQNTQQARLLRDFRASIQLYHVFIWWWSGVVVSALASINEVNQRRARLVLRRVTVSGFNSRCRTFISVCDQPATQGQLSLPSLRGQ